MKPSVIILAAMMVAGCTIDRGQDFDVDYKIEFQPAMYMHSAPSDVETYPESQDFGVSAWVLPEGMYWEDDSEEAEVFAALSCISCDESGRWKMSDGKGWPTKYERLTFIAYSPYEELCACNQTEGIVWTGVDMTKNHTDLLYTEPLEDMCKMHCGGVVTLPFRHAMCIVDFRIKNRVAEDEHIIVKKITMDAVRTKGDFRSAADPVWSLGDQMSPIVIYEGEYDTDGLPEPIGDERLFIPQGLDTEVTVAYDYVHASGSGLVMNLKTVPLKTVLEPGKRYTFTLSVGIDDVKFLTELIEDRIR